MALDNLEVSRSSSSNRQQSQSVMKMKIGQRRDPIADGSLFAPRQASSPPKASSSASEREREREREREQAGPPSSPPTTRTTTTTGSNPLGKKSHGSEDLGLGLGGCARREQEANASVSVKESSPNSKLWAKSTEALAIRKRFENLVRSLPQVLRNGDGGGGSGGAGGDELSLTRRKGSLESMPVSSSSAMPARASLLYPPPKFTEEENSHKVGGAAGSGVVGLHSKAHQFSPPKRQPLQRVTLLGDWWLAPLTTTSSQPHAPQDFCICGTEYSSFTDASNERMEAIRQRLDRNLVVTMQGNEKVKLIGRINEAEMNKIYKSGTSLLLAEGIPENWCNILRANMRETKVKKNPQNVGARDEQVSNTDKVERGGEGIETLSDHCANPAQLPSKEEVTLENNSGKQKREINPVQRFGFIPEDDACFCGLAAQKSPQRKATAEPEKRKVGRPRKLPLSDEVPLKRKVGRPKKIPVSSESKRKVKVEGGNLPPAPKRPVGRPRKVPMTEMPGMPTPDNVEVPQKRPVGRPRKVPIPGNVEEGPKRLAPKRKVEGPGSVPVAPKRPVGRPRKIPVPENEIAEAAPKRKVGRPRKIPIPENMGVPPKRKVGRPKKVPGSEAATSPPKRRGPGRPRKYPPKGTGDRALSSPAIDGLEISRIGRRIVPKLDFWNNESIKYDMITGEAIGIKVSSPSDKSGRGPVLVGTKRRKIFDENGLASTSNRDEDDWTPEQLEALSRAQLQVDPTSRNFWQEVAKLVNGKTADMCFQKHFQKHPTPKRKDCTKSIFGIEDDRIVANKPSAHVRKQMKRLRKAPHNEKENTANGINDEKESQQGLDGVESESALGLTPILLGKQAKDQPKTLAAAIVEALAEAQPNAEGDYDDDEEEDFYFDDMD